MIISMDNEEEPGLPVDAPSRPEPNSLESSSSEDDSDFEDQDSDSRLRTAANEIKKRNGDFQSQEVLYDFIYKFRDVVGQSDPLSGSLLHVAVEISDNSSRLQAEKTTPLVQALLKDHPHLLGMVDEFGQTPLYLAIRTRKYYMVEAMVEDCGKYPEWKSSLTDAIGIRYCENGSNCLHAIFREDLRAKAARALIRLSSDSTLSAQDNSGMTPLHYAVDYTRYAEPRIKMIDLFIARDEIMTTKNGAGRSFLDIVNHSGNSVYREHVLSRRRYEDEYEAKSARNGSRRPGQAEMTTSRDSPNTRDSEDTVQKESTKANASDLEYLESKDNKRLHRDTPRNVNANAEENRHLNSERSPDDSVGTTRQIEPQDTDEEDQRRAKRTSPRHKRHDKKAMQRNSEAMLRRLKLHYMRTRNAEMVISFLYGNNINDVQVVFDFYGLPLKPSDSSFLRGFEHMVFDEVLQYVAFPRNVRISRDSRNAVVSNNDSDMGRRDLGFFFDWLRQQKKVTHIINLHVDDEPCHSDEAIVSCLRGITVDHIDWQKFDMDPQTFSKLENASSIRELSLQWSGRNAVLRAWSEPEGLPMLKGLRKINLHIPSIDQMIDSQEWVHMNLHEFRSRLLQNVEKRQPQQESKVEICIYQATGEDQQGKALTLEGRSSAMGDAAAAQRWLKSVDLFANLVTTYHAKVLQSRGDRAPNMGKITTESKDDFIALIDDGIDLLDPSISADCIVGGWSLDSDGSRVKPFWGSEYGHGTVMAKTITRVCPTAKLYFIRPKIISSADGVGARADVRTTAMAIRGALDRRAAVISIPSPVLVSDSTGEERESLRSVLAEACDRGAVLFCCPPDTATTADSYYPAGYKPGNFFRIGPARADGKSAHEVGPMRAIDFIFPSVDVPNHTSIAPAAGETHHTTTLISGSSVAAALGTGLAALLLHCFKMVEFLGERFVDDAHETRLSKDAYRRLRTHDGMMSAFRNLGTVTEHKFINLWETFDPVIQVFEDPSSSDKEKFQCLNSFCVKLTS